MTNMLHEFDCDTVKGQDKHTFQRFMKAELDFYLNNEAGQKVIAIQYVGIPYEEL
jgi:p-hydroxybenzoate 3-monooxygenase